MSTHATKSIGRKILVRSLLIALPPLILLAAVLLIGVQSLSSNASDRVAESRETLSEETVVLGSQDQAISIAREINVVLSERVRDVAGWARSSEVVDAAKEAAADATERGLLDLDVEQLETDFDQLRVLSQTGPASRFLDGELDANSDFRQITFTDANGFNVAATSRPDDFVQSDETWWQQAITDGLSLSDVEYDAASDVFSVDIAVRIDDAGTDQVVGVLQTSLSISFVQSITTERALENVDYTIALADGRLIADTSSDHAQIRMMSFSFAGGAASAGLGSALAADLGPGESGTAITEEFIYGYTSTLADDSLDIGVEGFSGFDWIVLSSQPTEIAFAPLDGLEALNDDISRSGRNLALIAALMLVNGVAATIVLARRMSKSIVEPVRTLTDAASDAASSGLPAAVQAINDDGADIDDVAPAPVEISSDDELQTLAGAFNSVQSTALRLAAEQAKSRRNTTEMFVNLGRRNQSLLKRQLRFIDSLEENEQDPDTLESLFKLDHLATRMRRNAESLLVLAGDRSPRRWAAPIDVRSAVEAALAEVESYERVDFSSMAEGQIQGNIVADVAHILAEVIENGLNFSPPTAEVTVAGRVDGDRYIVTVVDEGFGMKQEEIERVNEQLATVLEITDVPSQQLGLFVVARLANRHGISVSLTDAPTGGLSVRIELPLVVDTSETAEADEPPSSDGAPVDAAVAEADAEVQELLAKAEAAMAKAAEVRAGRTDEEIEEEERRLAELRSKAGLASSPDAAPGFDDDAAIEPDDVDPATAGAIAGVEEAGADVESEDATAVQPEEMSEDDVVVAEAGDTPQPVVEVGEFSFPRRGGTSKRSSVDDKNEGQAEAQPAPKRRKSDASNGTNVGAATDAPADNTGPDDVAADQGSAGEIDVAAFGFKRRESKSSSTKVPPAGRRKADRAKPAPGKADDIAVVAEKSKNQWGSFQRAKKEAEAVTQETSDSEPAEAAGNTAGTKEQ